MSVYPIIKSSVFPENPLCTISIHSYAHINMLYSYNTTLIATKYCIRSKKCYYYYILFYI